MDHSVEGYFRRMDLAKLRIVCQIPDGEIIPEIKALALEILQERQEKEEK